MIQSVSPQLLGDFTETTLLIPHLVSEFRDCAILELSRALERELCVHDATRFTHAVLDHESLGSAVVGDIALPFARGADVRRLLFALGISEPGVRWGTTHLPNVHFIALIAAPTLDDHGYVPLITTLTNILRDEEALSELRSCATAEAIKKFLDEVHCLHCGASKS